jgi:REP element-mobilizing transposase RayT
MAEPIVIAHHLIWTVYGSWLPNDPRGSGSQAVASDVLAELGEVHYGRKKVQPAGWVVREFYEQARPLLTFPLLTFDATEIQTIAAGLTEVIDQQRYSCYACAVMPDHIHILIRKHIHSAEQMIGRLEDETCQAILALRRRDPNHPVWTQGGWKVFLDHPDDVRRTIRYIEHNPAGARLSRQEWPFVKEYDGWPLHPGHSPNSPYARRLREAGRY